ncbi:hypothetical protein MHU86_16498 [Fragilaria crotonensis]|nr:hypothetical protein MHU86_16498 [Fragilaria crotonensis]
MCPESPPETFDTCDINGLFSCVYGDAFVCDDIGWEFEHEKECFCGDDGRYHCVSNACPAACPATQPVEGEACTEFMGYYCSYDEFCCPGDDSSDACVPKTQCYCNTNGTITCVEPQIVCPSVCPVSNPIESNSSSLCTIDERYLCKYENGSESPYEVGETTCTCSSAGNYECTQSCTVIDIVYEDDAFTDAPPGNFDPEEDPVGTDGAPGDPVVEEDVEINDPSTGKKKKKKHAKKTKTKENKKKKDGKARSLLRRQLERPGGKIPFPE